jgi:GNAT superfamily N-acetyltransferase
MKILPFHPDDTDEILTIERENYRDLKLERFFWQPCRQIESLKKNCFKIVVKDESVKGYAAVYALDKTRFRLNLLVAPPAKRQGIGAKLLLRIEREAKAQGCRSLQARTLETTPGGLEFALANGFAEVHRMHGLSLRAGDFSFEKWSALGKKLAAGRFVVTTLAAELAAGNEPFEKLVELQKRAVEDWPLIDPTVSHNTDAEYLTQFFAGAKNPERVSIIKRREKYVGYTSAEKDDLLGTAVHPEHRGRGLATYLKAANLKLLIDAGVEYFESATANPAMIRVNEKLGYQLNGLTEIRLVKRL